MKLWPRIHEKWMSTKIYGKDVNTLIFHMGIHMMQLYILVTIHLDLENKEVPLLSRYLLVSYFQWEVFHIKYNVCDGSVS